jgi:hypothetical protein
LAGTTPADCRISASVLLSGKGIVQTHTGAGQISIRESVAVSLSDAIPIDLVGGGKAEPVQCLLEGSTWALRDGLVAVKAPAQLPNRPDLVQVHAVGCSFVDPFGDASASSTILRLPEPVLARGQASWRGQKNTFDARLGSFVAVAGQGGPGKQTLAQWTQLWGRAGDTDAKALAPGPPAKTAFDADAPQLDRLPLPPAIAKMLKKKG